MPESKDVVLPQDSASNAPRRRTVNGSIRSASGRQTERVRFSTKESVRISTRSPANDYPRKTAGDRQPKVVDPPTVSSPATDSQPTVTSRNKDLPPRKSQLLYHGISVARTDVNLVISDGRPMELSGLTHCSYGSTSGRSSNSPAACSSIAAIARASTFKAIIRG